MVSEEEKLEEKRKKEKKSARQRREIRHFLKPLECASLTCLCAPCVCAGSQWRRTSVPLRALTVSG